MKHFIRKPMYPVLLLAVILFSTCFLTIFQKGIRDDLREVDSLYANTQLTFKILVGEGGEYLYMDTYTGDKLRNLERIGDSCVLINCVYSMREPVSKPGTAMARGTENPDYLARQNGAAITYGDGYDGSCFQSVSEGIIPCIVSASLYEEVGLEFGKTMVIAGSEDYEQDPENAPSLTLTVIGMFQGGFGEGDIIVPLDIYLSKPGLLYNSNTMVNCFYRSMTLMVDPAYNREYAEIKEEVERILNQDGDYDMVTNIRTLEQAVGPVERKLMVQQLVIKPLAVILWIASGVTALLLGLSLQTEVFLRFLWGEKRWAVFGKMLLSVCGHLAVSAALSLLTVRVLAGQDWLGWATKYMAAVCGLSITIASGPLVYNCGRNLVKFYQSREG